MRFGRAFALEETLQKRVFSPSAEWPELKAGLIDIQDRRLKRNGVARHREMMLLSLNAPAVQEFPIGKQGHELSRERNYSCGAGSIVPPTI